MSLRSLAAAEGSKQKARGRPPNPNGKGKGHRGRGRAASIEVTCKGKGGRGCGRAASVGRQSEVVEEERREPPVILDPELRQLRDVKE